MKIPKPDPFLGFTPEAKAYFLAHGIKRPTDLDRAGLAYSSAALKAGCPPDQIANLIGAGIWLQVKQLEFASLARQCDKDGGPIYVGFGGPRGPGKSMALMSQVAADDCQRYPGLKCLFLRKVGRAGKEQFEDLRLKVFGQLKCNYRQGKDLTFENGSRIILGHFKDEKEIDNYLGQEYDLMLIEELTTFSKEKWDNILSCLRTSKEGWRPRVYAAWNWGGVGHCVPFGDVLTSKGWKPIQNVCAGDAVYSVSESGEIVLKVVDQTTSEEYTGQMIRVNANGLRMVFTPNHKVARLKNITVKNDGKFDLRTFDELPGHTGILRTAKYVGRKILTWALPEIGWKKNKTRQPMFLSGDNFCEFMGWYLSEGSVLNSKKKHEYRISIAQMKEHGRASIDGVMFRCGFKGNWNQKSFDFYDKHWHSYLSRFGKCRQKFIPWELKTASLDQLRLFFFAFVDGDGHWSKRGESGHCYTISKQLADDLCEVAFKLGFVVRLTFRQRQNRDGLSYELSFKTTKHGGTEILTGNHLYGVKTNTKRKTNVERFDYSGRVYCIGVPDTHNFILRQEGSVWVSGNSWVKRMFWDPYSENREEKTRFLRAKPYDNKHLDKEYIKFLESLTGWKRQSWLEGDPNFQAGQFFTTFSEQDHVLRAFDERKIVRWYGGLDYGWTHPTVFLLAGEDKDGNLIVLDEHSASQMTVQEHSSSIFAMLRPRNLMPRNLDFIAAGRDCFSKKEDGTTISDDYSAEGVELTPAEIDRINGWGKLLGRLGDPQKGIRPTLFIHERCKELIGQIPLAQHDEKRPEDVQKMNANPDDDSGGDDALDCVRNIVATSMGGSLSYCAPVALTEWGKQSLLTAG